MRSFIDTELALALYVSLIEPIFLYCCHLYDGTSKMNRNRLRILQNNALRAVMQVNSHFSATEMHDILNVEWLDVSRKHHTCAEVYKLVNGKGPPVFVELFRLVQPRRVLRSDEHVKLNNPRTRSEFAAVKLL